jgi:DNA repair protein RecO (recombination protein O)
MPDSPGVAARPDGALAPSRPSLHMRAMEWQAPAVVLDARPYGEGAAVVTLLTEAHGRHAGLAKGGASRAQAGLWLPGNLVEARWTARLADQLGALSGELVHPAAALAMEDPLALALLSSACAIAADALPEREPHPRAFHALVSLIGHLAGGAEGVMADYVRWECIVLAELGYGLDLDACAVTGVREGLTHVSPRTGRAVSAGAAAPYAGRLLDLPRFLLDGGAGGPRGWQAGLRLTGHFLERDAFGARHRPVPEARHRLADRIAALAGAED